jgi:hypothetical protein
MKTKLQKIYAIERAFTSEKYDKLDISDIDVTFTFK